MKTRESGMPGETVWERFFDAPAILGRLGLLAEARGVVEFGCGYGTFTIPAAHLVHGTVYAFDIEPEMVELVRAKAQQAGLANIVCEVRDFVEQGTGLADGTADYAMLFNILHAEQPVVLLREAHRVLRPSGICAVIHWIYDASTPRGPDLSIRPRPEQCAAWLREAGFETPSGILSLPPYHYGLAGRKR
jgi:SAM-dependent methyltransferase